MATRLISTFKESGKPLPTFSDDDVIDFVVTEALVMKWLQEQHRIRKEAEAEAKREAFKRGAPGDPIAGVG